MEYSMLPKLEAALFMSGNPLPLERLSEVLEEEKEMITLALAKLQESYEVGNRGIRLKEVAGGWQLVTWDQVEDSVKRLGMTIQPKLSPAMMEGLAIIAYRQPVTRQEIEQIRGVNSDRNVKLLHELELVEELGRKEVVGRPILYGTTAKFLHIFGIRNIESLPRWEEFQEEKMGELEALEVAGELTEQLIEEIESKEKERNLNEGTAPEDHS